MAHASDFLPLMRWTAKALFVRIVAAYEGRDGERWYSVCKDGADPRCTFGIRASELEAA